MKLSICADFLYRGPSTSILFLKDVFIELMEIATKSVSFSFNEIMYRQIEGVSMVSPLDPHSGEYFRRVSSKTCLKSFLSSLTTLR